MHLTHWMDLLRHRWWFRRCLSRTIRRRKPPQAISHRIESLQDRTLLSAYAMSDTASIDQNTTAQIDVLTNDYDMEGGERR